MTITIYVLWTVWPDEHMNIKHKARISAYAPIMYFAFYVMNMVQLVAVIRCLINNKQVLRKVKTSGTWTSPQRAGGTINFG